MFGGVQRVYEHYSSSCNCNMQFGVYLPPQALVNKNSTNQELKRFSTMFWLSGLTCTEQNFITKAGAQRVAAELGLIIITPDTSPRGGLPDDKESYDFGQGAGFYLNATQMPWSKNYHMYSYIVDELKSMVVNQLPVDKQRIGISGHSMGGHGALTIHLKNPDVFKSASAFSPIVAASKVPWGRKALKGYLGNDEKIWTEYDATLLVAKKPSQAKLLIDQGSADDFLEEQLKPDLFEQACKISGQPYELNMREGYDHSYYFIASFIENHLLHHADALANQ